MFEVVCGFVSGVFSGVEGPFADEGRDVDVFLL
jgi:hypothetical protein